MRRELFENLEIGQYFHQSDSHTTYQKVVKEHKDAWCYIGRHYIQTTNIVDTSTGKRHLMLDDDIVHPIDK